MIPAGIKEHILKLKNIQREIDELSQFSSTFTLEDLFREVDDAVRWFNPGERDVLFKPHWKMKNKLDALREAKDQGKFKTAFKTSRTALSTAVKTYVRELEHGIHLLSQE